MLSLNKKELVLLDEAQLDYELWLEQVEHEGSSWWMLRVDVPVHGLSYEIQTYLGQRRLWRDLDKAVSFIRETSSKRRALVSFR